MKTDVHLRGYMCIILPRKAPQITKTISKFTELLIGSKIRPNNVHSPSNADVKLVMRFFWRYGSMDSALTTVVKYQYFTSIGQNII